MAVVVTVTCSLVLPETSAYAGEPDWAQIELTPGEYLDGAAEVAVNHRSGAVHVAGLTGITRDHEDLALVDYTGDGTRLADRRYDGPPSSGRLESQFPVVGIAVSPTLATVYVAGKSFDGDQTFVDTVAWGRTGPPQWTSHYPLPDFSSAIGLARNEATGDVYTLANIDGDGPIGDTQLLLAFSADGTPRWESRFRVTPESDTGPSSVAVDRVTGNVYTTGRNVTGRNVFVVTTAHNAQGQLLWSGEVPGDGGRVVAVDHASGHVVVAGLGPDGEPLTLAYASTGQLLWSVAEPGRENETLVDLVVDPGSGTVVQTGYEDVATPAGGDRDNYVTRAYGAGGQLLWTQRYNGGADRGDRASAMALDSRRGVVYVTGTSDREKYLSTPTDATTVAYDLAGNQLRVDRYASRYHFNVAYDVAVDLRDGSVHVVGDVVTQSGINSGAFVLGYPTASPTG